MVASFIELILKKDEQLEKKLNFKLCIFRERGREKGRKGRRERKREVGNGQRKHSHNMQNSVQK